VINMPKLELHLTSGGSINQGLVTKSGAKALPSYTRNAGIIFIDPEDFKKLEIYPLTPVKVTSEMNEIIVFAEISEDGPHPGIAFMPRGPWCNALVDPYTYSSGCAMFKDTKISVEPAPKGEKPLDMPALMKKFYIDRVA